MIPKIIHYCWFGRNPLPPLAIKCIESWKKYFPGYEIKEWNEDNFDVNIVSYTKEAYQAKKYAFVSDYARFWILYKYGGIYFDTDVEVIKPMEDIVYRGPFMGREHMSLMPKENSISGRCIPVNPGLGLGAVPALDLYSEILNFYSSLHFVLPNGSFNTATVVQYTTEILLRHGLKDADVQQQCMGITIYPKEYFCPKSFEDGKIYLTENTYTIHHFAASWLSPKQRFIHFIKSLLGVELSIRCARIYKKICKKK